MTDYRKELIARGASLAILVVLALSSACSKDVAPLDPTKVAAFFAPAGSLTINGGAPAVGREAIAAKAKQYMTEFPDLAVEMDELSLFEGHIVFYWTLTGRNSGPGGTGKLVSISGSEEWTLGPDGLIATSKGTYDEAEYQRQLAAGVVRGR